MILDGVSRSESLDPPGWNQILRKWIVGAVLLGIGLALHQWILLRYGLEERLGGQVLSMAPTFYWEEISLTQFVSELVALAVRAWQRPLDFLILSGSPLDMILRKQTWPIQHLGTLIATALFVLLVSGGVIMWGNRPKMKNHPVLVLIVVVIFLGLVDLWILVGS